MFTTQKEYYINVNNAFNNTITNKDFKTTFKKYERKNTMSEVKHYVVNSKPSACEREMYTNTIHYY